MLKHARLDHRFVHHIPEVLEGGIIYVSVDYATAVHKCCCGCGEEVVTPLSPRDWKMIFDGETISLSPSIGNWNMACSSHYWIDRGKVIEAKPRTKKDADQNRSKESAASTDANNDSKECPSRSKDLGLWARIKRSAKRRGGLN